MVVALQYALSNVYGAEAPVVLVFTNGRLVVMPLLDTVLSTD